MNDMIEPSRESVLAKLREALLKVTEQQPSTLQITESTRLREDVGLDSYAALELLFLLEDMLDVRIPQQIATSFRTAGDVVSFVLEALTSPPSQAAELQGGVSSP